MGFPFFSDTTEQKEVWPSLLLLTDVLSLNVNRPIKITLKKPQYVLSFQSKAELNKRFMAAICLLEDLRYIIKKKKEREANLHVCCKWIQHKGLNKSILIKQASA